MGVMMTYSSYLPDKTDINNSAFMTAFANCGFEFLCAIGVFGILGFMATSQGIGIDQVASQGIGLAFVAFPKVFGLMGSFGTIFGVLFFACLVFAGLTSSVSLVEAFSSAIIDKTGMSRKKMVTIGALVGYLISVLYATGAGLYFLDIIDNFVNSYGIVVVGLVEAVAIGWFFGPEKIRNHTNSMSYFTIGKWWDVMIKFVTPAILTFMLVQNVINEIKTPYGGYSNKALLVFGWSIVVIGIGGSLILSRRRWGEKNLIDFEDNERKVG
jgi:NSS family neurotransmitter:Na+ symporter